jgi:hypothetical protein
MVALVSPLWRWLVTDLCTESITILDHLASDRNVTPKLNEPLEMTCTVPSDNSEVNRLHTDDFPFVAEGVRLLYGFRREYDTVEPFGSPPHGYYTIRASALILQTDDAAQAEDARTRITAKDAWGYLDYIPVYVAPTEGAYLVPRDGYTYPDDLTADEIALQAFDYAYGFAAFGQYIPPNYSEYVQGPCGPANLFTDFGQSGFYTGTIETCAIPPGFRVDPGTSLGELLRNLCTAGYMDIVFEPIYDPVNRPGYLNQISIYAQDPADPSSGAGVYNYSARFSWDKAGRTAMGADNLYDGTMRANWIQWFRGVAGPRVDPAVSAASIATYGEYWSMQHVPEESLDNGVVQDMEAMQLYLRQNYRETLTMNPAPERAPEPFVDYELGDRVPVFISDNMRQPLPPATDDTLVWQRVYGIPIDIDDNGTETIRELIVGPIGAPP